MTSELPSINEVSFAEISKNAKKKGAHFERYIVDEKLNEVQRMLYLLKDGTKIQKKTALSGMPDLITENKEAAEPIVQYFNDSLWKDNPETQVLCARYIHCIFHLLSEEQMRVMHGIIKTMLTLKSPNVIAAWEEPLLQSIFHVPIDIIHDDLLKICISKGSLSETEKNRVYACKMFGAFSRRLDSHAIEELFLSRAISMCQDTAYSVRKQMAEELPEIAIAIGLSKAKSVLSQELFQLVNDETREVKQTAFASLVKLLDFFDASFQKREVLPIFIRWMKQPPSDLFRSLASLFGEYLWKLSTIINDEPTISAFCTFYMRTSENPDPSVREFCAYHFPAVLKSIGGKRYTTYLSKIFRSFCIDSDPSIRRKIAAGFHEVAHILGPEQASSNLKDLFVMLLRDEDPDTRGNVAANMHTVFQNFIHPSDVSMKEEIFSSLLPEVVYYEQTIEKFSWKHAESFYSNFQYFGNFFSRENLIDVIIPMLKAQLQHGSMPVKQSAAKAFVLILRKLESNSKQVEIFCHLIEELRYSKNYRNRMTFIDLCEVVMQHYSAKFFYNNFVDQIITLNQDPVSNVRRKLCFILPKIKVQLLIARRPSKFSNKINDIAESLLQDKDTDVREAAEQLNMELMNIDRERAKHGTRNAFAAEESADKKKEAEERSWGELDLSSLRKRLEGTDSTALSAGNTPATPVTTTSTSEPPGVQAGTLTLSSTAQNGKPTTTTGAGNRIGRRPRANSGPLPTITTSGSSSKKSSGKQTVSSSRQARRVPLWSGAKKR